MEQNPSPIRCISPLVSVIIPAYNAAPFLQATLESVLGQSYQNFEVLVVDDGSGDDTVQIVQQLAQQDNRIILIQQENAGVAAARNAAILQAKGEFIAPIDADDIWYPEKLEKQVMKMLESPGLVGVVYAWSAMIDEEGQLTGGFFIGNQRGYVLPALVYRFFLGNASVPLIRRNCLEKVGLYNQELRARSAQGAEDWDICLRLAEHYQFEVVPEFLIGYRQVSNSMSRSVGTIERSYHLVMDSIRQRHPEIPEILFRWSQASMYFYSGSRLKECGDYLGSCRRYWQSLILDPWVIMKRPQLYKDLLVNVLSLVWPLRLIIQAVKAKRKVIIPVRSLSLQELTANTQENWSVWVEDYQQRLKRKGLE